MSTLRERLAELADPPKLAIRDFARKTAAKMKPMRLPDKPAHKSSTIRHAMLVGLFTVVQLAARSGALPEEYKAVIELLAEVLTLLGVPLIIKGRYKVGKKLHEAKQ